MLQQTISHILHVHEHVSEVQYSSMVQHLVVFFCTGGLVAYRVCRFFVVFFNGKGENKLKNRLEAFLVFGTTQHVIMKMNVRVCVCVIAAVYTPVYVIHINTHLKCKYLFFNDMLNLPHLNIAWKQFHHFNNRTEYLFTEPGTGYKQWSLQLTCLALSQCVSRYVSSRNH